MTKHVIVKPMSLALGAKILRVASYTIILLAILLCDTISADVLNIPERKDPSSRNNSQNLPTRGLTMQEVYKQFGNPNEMFEAVGQPPISQWVYKNYTVTFEHEYVIHAVIHRNK